MSMIEISKEKQIEIAKAFEECGCSNYKLDFLAAVRKFAIVRKSKKYTFDILFEDLLDYGIVCEFMSMHNGKDEIICHYM